MRSVGWMAAGYAAFEAVLASRRQVRDPGRDLPPAIVGILILGSVAFAVTTLVTAGLGRFGSMSPVPLARVLADASFLPGWTSPFLAAVGLVLATSACLMVVARQLHALSRDGALDEALDSVIRRAPCDVAVVAYHSAGVTGDVDGGGIDAEGYRVGRWGGAGY